MYLAPQVDKFIFRDLALLVADPTSLVCASRSIYDTFNNPEFEFTWFSLWHGIHCPHTPWQYAAVTWRRLGSTTAEQLVDWLLRYGYWIQQQHDAEKQAVHSSAAVKKPPKARRPFRFSYEGRFSLFPACMPSPFTIREAKKLLRRDRAVEALLQLCPNPGFLLLPHIAKAKNTRLLQQLVAVQTSRNWLTRITRRSVIHHVVWLGRSDTSQEYPTHLIACYQALSAGNTDTLQTLLINGTKMTFQDFNRRLLQYAARHGNAAGIKTVQAWGAPSKPVLRPQHLTMAAGRTDPWAAEAVQQLLHLLGSQQQLKPSSMRGAYLAACGTGNQPVLQALVEYGAAAAPKWHFPVLLQAAAAAGNLLVVRQLFGLQDIGGGSGSSNSSSSHISQESAGRQQRAALLAGTLASFDWTCLTPEQIISVLSVALPGSRLSQSWQNMNPDSKPFTTHIHDANSAASGGYCYQSHLLQQQRAIADLVWQQLVISPGKMEVMAKCLSQLTMEVATVLWQLWRVPAPFAEVSIRASWLHQKLAGLSNLIDWGVPALVYEHQIIQQAADAGHFQQALQMFNLATKRPTSLLSTRHFNFPSSLLAAILGGRLRHAAAAGNAAAVAQIDNLAAFCSMMFAKDALQAEATALAAYLAAGNEAAEPPTLLPNMNRPAVITHMSSGIQGQTVSAAALWEALAMPDSMLAGFAADIGLGLDYAIHTKWNSRENRFMPLDALRAAETTAKHRMEAAFTICQKQSAHAAETETLVCEIQEVSELISQLRHEVQEFDQLADQPDGGADAVVAATNPDEDSPRLQLLDIRPTVDEHLAPLTQTPARVPTPLWQQCFLVAAARVGIKQDEFHLRHSPEHYVTAGVHAAAAAALHAAAGAVGAGSSSSSSAVVNISPSSSSSSSSRSNLQQLFDSPLFVSTPPAPAADCPGVPWGAEVGAAAVQCCDKELLQWSWAEPNHQKIWGHCPETSIPWLGECTPISNSRTRHPQQQQLKMQELQQWQHTRSWYTQPSPQQQEQHIPAGPKFAQQAAGMALLLLNNPPTFADKRVPDLLSRWLRFAVRPGMPQPDLERAKAVVAAVAAAPVVPVGAGILRKEALRAVLRCGDLDLITVVMCWLDRLDVLPDLNDEFFGEAAEAEDDLLDDDEWAPGMLGADGQPLPVPVPGEDDDDDDINVINGILMAVD